MGHGGMNGNRDGRLVGVRGKDNDILVEGHTATLGTRAMMPMSPVMDELMLLDSLVTTEVSARCWSRIPSRLLAGRSSQLIVLTFLFF
jgi:hypothetical protein